MGGALTASNTSNTGPVTGAGFTCVQDLFLLSAAVVVVVSEVPQQWDGGYHFGVTNHRASTTLKCYKSWTSSSVYGRRLEICWAVAGF